MLDDSANDSSLEIPPAVAFIGDFGGAAKWMTDTLSLTSNDNLLALTVNFWLVNVHWSLYVSNSIDANDESWLDWSVTGRFGAWTWREGVTEVSETGR